MRLNRSILMLALIWAALAVAPGVSEPIKVAGVALAAALLMTVSTPEQHPPRKVAALFAVALAVAASACLALEPSLAFVGSLARAQGALLALALLPIAIHAARLSAADRRWIYAGVAVLGAGVSGYALMQRFGFDPLSWQGLVAGRPAATLSNASTLAGWLVLLLPTTIALAATRAAKARWWSLLAALQLLALIATGTRSALLALLLIAVLVWWLVDARRRRFGLLLALLGAAAIGTAAAWRPASLQDRAFLWQVAAQALLHPPAIIDLAGNADPHAAWRPWFGYGPDQQQAVLAAARGQNSGQRAEAQGLEADRAHQALLDRALELGLAGVLAGLFLLLTVARTGRARWQVASAEERMELLALTVALAAWLLHLQTSFALSGDRTLAWVWIGFALAGAAPAPTQLSPWRSIVAGCLRVAGIAALLLGALAICGWLPAPMQDRLAPAQAAEQQYLIGQRNYALALTLTSQASAIAMVDAAHAFERAAVLRRYDCDAALGAASAWIEAAAQTTDFAPSLAAAKRWNSACAAMHPGDPRVVQVDARIRTVAAQKGADR